MHSGAGIGGEHATPCVGARRPARALACPVSAGPVGVLPGAPGVTTHHAAAAQAAPRFQRGRGVGRGA